MVLSTRLPWILFWCLTICIPSVFLEKGTNYFSSPAVQVQCSSKLLSITLTSDKDFNGVVYVGDQNRDCRMLGKGTQKLDVTLPVKQCGIVTTKSEEDPNKVVHKVQIYIQLHHLVQQNSDVRIIRDCVAPLDDSSSSISGKGVIMDPDQQKFQIVAPSWMEVVRGGRQDSPKIRGPVKVGETIGIVVKANAKANQDSLVTSCFASDGTAAAPEMFVNEIGCPVDTSVVPAFTKLRDEAAATVQTHWTKFPAFKFPDRTRLYLTCQVVVCDLTCPKPRCSVAGGHSRQIRQDVSPNDNWRQARVVDRVDVVNSVRVVNSDLDSLSDPNNPVALEETDAPKKVCWPLKSLMTAIGILAAILLICLILALCFWWSRRQRKRRQLESSYGTQTNSMYNPSTNYYSMEQYPDSHQHSATNGHSEFEPEYAHTDQQDVRRYRDRSF